MKNKKITKDKVLSFRITSEELDVIKRTATRSGKTFGDFILTCLREEVRRWRK